MTWSLPVEAFSCLETRFLAGALIVELGSGLGTARLGERFTVFSVEHDRSFIGLYGSTYIHAPIVKGWYDVEVLRRELPVAYECLVVDGPPGSIGRAGFLKNLDLFLDVPILIDDVHRPIDKRIALLVSKMRGKMLRVYQTAERRAFATIGW